MNPTRYIAPYFRFFQLWLDNLCRKVNAININIDKLEVENELKSIQPDKVCRIAESCFRSLWEHNTRLTRRINRGYFDECTSVYQEAWQIKQLCTQLLIVS